jgi:hypothetical protein
MVSMGCGECRVIVAEERVKCRPADAASVQDLGDRGMSHGVHPAHSVGLASATGEVREGEGMKLILLVSLAWLAFLVGPIVAHDEFRVIGTIMKVTKATIEVKQAVTNDIITMVVDEDTPVTRDKQKLAIAELTPGLTVVVDATGDSLRDLVVRAIRIIPPPKR